MFTIALFLAEKGEFKEYTHYSSEPKHKCEVIDKVKDGSTGSVRDRRERGHRRRRLQGARRGPGLPGVHGLEVRGASQSGSWAEKFTPGYAFISVKFSDHSV